MALTINLAVTCVKCWVIRVAPEPLKQKCHLTHNFIITPVHRHLLKVHLLWYHIHLTHKHSLQYSVPLVAALAILIGPVTMRGKGQNTLPV